MTYYSANGAATESHSVIQRNTCIFVPRTSSGQLDVDAQVNWLVDGIAGVDGAPMYELQIPTAFDRLLTAAI